MSERERDRRTEALETRRLGRVRAGERDRSAGGGITAQGLPAEPERVTGETKRCAAFWKRLGGMLTHNKEVSIVPDEGIKHEREPAVNPPAKEKRSMETTQRLHSRAHTEYYLLRGISLTRYSDQRI